MVGAALADGAGTHRLTLASPRSWGGGRRPTPSAGPPSTWRLRCCARKATTSLSTSGCWASSPSSCWWAGEHALPRLAKLPPPPSPQQGIHLPVPHRPPFHSADPQQIYSRILDGVFSFPAFLGEAACSLIGKLCRCSGHPEWGPARAGGDGGRGAGCSGVRWAGLWHLGCPECITAPQCGRGGEGVPTYIIGSQCAGGVPPKPLPHTIPLQTPSRSAPGEHGQRHPWHQEAQVREGSVGPSCPTPPGPSCSPPLSHPRWFGAVKWRKLLLRQLEAPTLRLIKEVKWGLGGGLCGCF